MKIQRRFAPTGGQFRPESVARFTGIRTPALHGKRSVQMHNWGVGRLSGLEYLSQLVDYYIIKPNLMNQNIFRRVKMVRYLSAAGRGVSGAQVMGSEDGTQYFVKFKENGQGLRVLVNELVANGIACYLGLPCPEGVIAEIDGELLSVSNIAYICGQQVSPGQHFGNVRLEGLYGCPPSSLISQVNNKDAFPGIVLFDILTRNSNRNNEGNYLIQQANQDIKLFIIDHGNCFGSPNWDTSILGSVGTWDWNVLPEVAYCISGNDPFRTHIDKINSLNDDLISSIVDGVPEEWEVSNNERQALKSFLSGQRNEIENIIMRHKTSFSNWH